jgi:hypothetical protein
MRAWWVASVVCLLVVGPISSLFAAQGAPIILALGSTSFLNRDAIQAGTGVEVASELGSRPLKDFAVLVLANIAYASLPGPVQEGLADYVRRGGAVLITGGPQAFGSGGYQAVAELVPFQIRNPSDWRPIPARFPVPLQPGHPILAGVEFISVVALNDMNPGPGAMEILQAAGGGSAGPTGSGGGGSYPYPLIAELRVGAGDVIGIAFDLNEFTRMRDLGRFMQNTLQYLLSISLMGR